MTLPLTGKAPRLLSLDFFRGFTVAAMILVNDPGGPAYAPLEHSKWNGCTPTDLIFPSFLFMVGVSIVYALQNKKQDVSGHGKIILNAFRRMVTLIIIALLIHLFYHPDLAHLRFPGVLQRIAVVYFVAALLYLKTTQRVRDWVFAIALIGYWLVMAFVPVPDGHQANLEPFTNLGAWVDRAVFTTNHMWSESKYFDPEGLLGTIPALGTALFGIRVGEWLKRTDRDSNVKTSWLFIYGIIAIVLGMIWDLFFPINKALWSSSFVLYAGGISTLGLTLSYWFIDVLGNKKFIWPFLVFGTNAITAYILADIVPALLNYIKFNSNGNKVPAISYFNQTLIVPFFSPMNASLVFAICFVLMIWIIMYPLYVKKVIIKV